MRQNLIRSASRVAAVLLLAGLTTAFAASKKGEDQNVRTVQGTALGLFRFLSSRSGAE